MRKNNKSIKISGIIILFLIVFLIPQISSLFANTPSKTVLVYISRKNRSFYTDMRKDLARLLAQNNYKISIQKLEDLNTNFAPSYGQIIALYDSELPSYSAAIKRSKLSMNTVVWVVKRGYKDLPETGYIDAISSPSAENPAKAKLRDVRDALAKWQ